MLGLVQAKTLKKGAREEESDDSPVESSSEDEEDEEEEEDEDEEEKEVTRPAPKAAKSQSGQRASWQAVDKALKFDIGMKSLAIDEDAR
eukprot:3106560-Rhodomonas_salina.2